MVLADSGVGSGLSTGDDGGMSTGAELLALGWEVNANLYRLVGLAARFDDGLDWFYEGAKSAAAWIAQRLGVELSTAREWVRVGHQLRYLPLVDAAFGAQEISYAKARILTRWADDGNEARLLELAYERHANRLTTAIARELAGDGETDEERDDRLNEFRSVTSWTDGDGMCVIRAVLPPSVAKHVMAAVDEVVRKIAETPVDTCDDPVDDEPVDDEPFDDRSAVGLVGEGVGDVSGDAFGGLSVVEGFTERSETLSGDTSDRRVAVERSLDASDTSDERGAGDDRRAGGGQTRPVCESLAEVRRRWKPAGDDGFVYPSLAQQRADAFVVLFLGAGVELTTEVVVHVRGDGVTFDDGTPTTGSAVVRELDDSFVRLLIHDAQRRPINASSRRRRPTKRQKRVVMETHNHECTSCQTTDLLEIHHDPPYQQTGHSITGELEPKCGPCHDAEHRLAS